MLFITIPRHHRIGDTAAVRINGDPAKLTWQDAETLVINGTDKRRIRMVQEATDGAGQPCWSFIAGDSAEDIATGEAPDEVTITTPEWVRTFRQRK